MVKNGTFYDPFSTDQEPPKDEGLPLPVASVQRSVYVPPSEDDVPKGSAKEVLEWVGTDKDRADAALDAELSKPNLGRKGLRNDLADILSA